MPGTFFFNWTSSSNSEYTGIENSVSRTTPAITDDSIIIGDQNGGHLIAVDKHTGARKWVTQLDLHVGAIITQSPVVYGDRVFVGVSSSEEDLAVNPNYPCCSFRGSMLVLDKDCEKYYGKRLLFLKAIVMELFGQVHL